MFARNVTIHLKTNCLTEYTKTVESQIIPMLRKQTGFQDEISLVEPGGTEAIGISLWKTKEDAENYNRTTYKKVLTTLADIIVGTPKVHTYEVTCNAPL